MSCNSTKTNVNIDNQRFSRTNFEYKIGDKFYCIITDSTTNIEYLYNKDTGNLSVLYDINGQPMKYNK